MLFFSCNYTLAGGLEVAPPWKIFLGGFGAIYDAFYTYKANFFQTGPINYNLTRESQQFGYSAGGQLGVLYTFHERYYIDLAVSFQSNSNHATDNMTFGTNNFGTHLQQQFKINYNADIAGGLGVNITPQTHFYGKIGASYARFTEKLIAFNPVVSAAQAVLRQFTIRKNLWGYIVGFGLSYDFGKLVTIFAEYDYYEFGNNNLDSVDNVALQTVPGVSHYTQNVGIDVSSVRVGLNFRFAV